MAKAKSGKRGGARPGAGRKSREVEDIRLDACRNEWGRLVRLNPLAWDRIEEILKDPNANPKALVEAIKLVVSRTTPEALFVKALEMALEELKAKDGGNKSADSLTQAEILDRIKKITGE